MPGGVIFASQKYSGTIINLYQKGGVMSERWHILHVGQHANLKNKVAPGGKRQQEETDYAEPRNPD